MLPKKHLRLNQKIQFLENALQVMQSLAILPIWCHFVLILYCVNGVTDATGPIKIYFAPYYLT